MKQIEHQQRAAELPLGEVNVADPGLYQLGGIQIANITSGLERPNFVSMTHWTTPLGAGPVERLYSNFIRGIHPCPCGSSPDRPRDLRLEAGRGKIRADGLIVALGLQAIRDSAHQ
jgi:hypothetical protein